MRTLEEVNRDIAIETVAIESVCEEQVKVLNDLYAEHYEIMQQHREMWDDENYATKIDCPVHITHPATLFVYGHRYAGNWECEAGKSGACAHYDTEAEPTEDFDGNEDAIYICVRCRVAVDGDPIADRESV